MKKTNNNNNKYYECYAKKILECVYNEDWRNNFGVIKDKPDIQSEELSIGVEVTSSAAKHERKINSIVQNCHDDKINKIAMQNLLQKEFVQVVCYEENYAIIPQLTNDNFVNNIINIIAKKTNEKLSHYKHFNSNMLYIFTLDYDIDKSDIEDLFAFLKFTYKGKKDKFDLYFIDCITKLYILDINKENYDEKSIPEFMIERIKKEAQIESNEANDSKIKKDVFTEKNNQ